MNSSSPHDPTTPPPGEGPKPPTDPGDSLPEVLEAHFGEARLRELFDDLRRTATVIGVRMKGGLRDMATSGSTLSDAYDALVSGAVRGVQIDYQFDDRHWVDTVMPASPGFRMIRMQSGGPAGSTAP